VPFIVVQFGSTTFTPRLNLLRDSPIVWPACAVTPVISRARILAADGAHVVGCALVERSEPARKKDDANHDTSTADRG
jgi:hypothetical protein